METSPHAEEWPDCRVGPVDAADRYRLRECLSIDGGEGEIWLATNFKQDGQEEHKWAVKIVDGRRHVIGNDQTANDVLDDFKIRYQTSKYETDQLDVPGAVGASEVFFGSEPHQPGTPGTGRMLYVVSRWLDGTNLIQWRRNNPGFAGFCDVLHQLAVILDAVAKRNLVHRDIAPGNVMVGADGQVRLIDFTFARPSDSAMGTVIVKHNGYTAPEALIGHYGLAADRYSFGSVAFFLLIGATPPVEDAEVNCEATLVQHGASPGLAAHVAALLRRDPAARPESLTDWVVRLRDLGHQAPPSGRYNSLVMTVDGTASRVVTAASPAGVYGARLSAGLAWELARDKNGPAGVTRLAAVTDGSGCHVTFAATEDGAVFGGTMGTWVRLGSCAPGAGIAAARDPYGVATAYVVNPDSGEMDTLAIGLDRTTRRIPSGRPVNRILSATAGQDGSAAVFVLLPGGLACLASDEADVVSRSGAFDAAGCLDRWGALRCYQILASQRTLTCFDRAAGRWAETARAEMPSPATEVACVGHRDGVTVAIAGAEGLYVTAHEGDFGTWHQLSDRPSSQLSLEMGSAWRLQLSALVEGQVGLATERFSGWPPALTML